MTEFIEFCREYGVYILTFVCFVVEIIFIFIKRKPSSIDDFLYCLNEVRTKVADLCTAVEAPGNGEVKRDTVIKACKITLENLIGRKLTHKEITIMTDFVKKDIESVLNAPQKKEIKNEK